MFTPVAKIESIRMLLAIAAILDWEIHVIDVDSAFLNSKMPEDKWSISPTSWLCR